MSLQYNDIFVKKDTLPKTLLNNVISVVRSRESFPLFLSDSISGVRENSYLDQFGLSHVLYNEDNGGINSNFFYEFFPIIYFIEQKFNITIKKLIRMRIGINLKISSNNIIHKAHTDFDFPHTTALVYLNTTDGDTLFYDNDGKIIFRSSPVENKCILFNGSIPHSSSTPTQTFERIALNINFLD